MAIVFKALEDYILPTSDEILIRLEEQLTGSYPGIADRVMESVREGIRSDREPYIDEMNEATWFLLTAYEVMVQLGVDEAQAKALMLNVVIDA